MNRMQKILVPYDFGAEADAALEYATYLAQSTGAWIEVLHVCELPLMAMPDAVVPMAAEEAVSEAEGLLADRLDKLRQSGFERVRSRIEVGTPVERILSVVQAGKPDLLVMGTHGRTGIRRFVIGSVAERLVRAAPCPVLTVHAPHLETLPASESRPGS